MKVLILQNRLGLEGRTRCVVEFVRLLNERGIEPRIACLTYQDEDIGRGFGLPDLRYELSRLAPWPQVSTAHNVQVLATNLLAGRSIRRYRPELVFNSNTAWSFLPAGPRYIHYVHFPFKVAYRYMSRFNRGPGRAYAAVLNLLLNERHLPPRSEVIANSEFASTAMRDLYSLDVRVVYPPAWNGRLQPGRPGARRVVTLGSIHPDKRQLEQLAVARALPDWTFTLLGSPASKRFADEVRSEAGRLPNVTVVLDAARGRIDDELARASHFVHSNRTEGFGIAVVEAAAAGCIPVVPDAGGVREIVRPGALRYTSVEGCIEALRASSGDAGLRLLQDVQSGLARFTAEAFRSAMLAIMAPGPGRAPAEAVGDDVGSRRSAIA